MSPPGSASALAQPLCGGQPDLAHLLPRYQETIRLPRVRVRYIIRHKEHQNILFGLNQKRLGMICEQELQGVNQPSFR